MHACIRTYVHSFTRAGKTHTMLGNGLEDDFSAVDIRSCVPKWGLIPRAVKDLFATLSAQYDASSGSSELLYHRADYSTLLPQLGLIIPTIFGACDDSVREMD